MRGCHLTVRKVKIVKVQLDDEKVQNIQDYIAEEIPLHLFINNKLLVTIMCSPTDLKEFAIGHLLSEGIIESVNEIEQATISDRENSCYITLKQAVNIEKRISLVNLRNRVIPSICGSISPYQFKGKKPYIKSDLKIKAQVICESVNALNYKATGFKQTGALHVAAVYQKDGTLIALAEDIGRHNAVDKVIGIAVTKKVNLGECFLTSSGRLSGDMTYKAAKMGIPIIASISAALSSGLDAAKETNVTLVGFVRGKRLNIYSASERIIL